MSYYAEKLTVPTRGRNTYEITAEIQRDGILLVAKNDDPLAARFRHRRHASGGQRRAA